MQPARRCDEATRLAKERRGSWDDNIEDCSVCMRPLDDPCRRPRTLPCGHTFCTACIDWLIKDQGQVPCPTCCIEHPVPESGQFPVSYTIEGLIRRLRDAPLASALPGEDTTTSTASTVTEHSQKDPNKSGERQKAEETSGKFPDLHTGNKAKDLRTLTQPTRNLLQADRVFATHKTEGRSRHARISLEDGRLYLHFLQDQTLPLGAVNLQMDELVPAALPCLVFLDLTWPVTTRRRVIIRLDPDTPMGRQFVLLCTGQRGPCYANTKIHGVAERGQPGEYVGGGDYERKNGWGGDALLPDLDKGDYWESGRAGAVCRGRRGGDKSACNTLFGILTRDREEGLVWSGAFGEVVDGLEGLVEAAQHRPIKEVTVVDCGVVLWGR